MADRINEPPLVLILGRVDQPVAVRAGPRAQPPYWFGPQGPGGPWLRSFCSLLISVIKSPSVATLPVHDVSVDCPYWSIKLVVETGAMVRTLFEVKRRGPRRALEGELIVIDMTGIERVSPGDCRGRINA